MIIREQEVLKFSKCVARRSLKRRKSGKVVSLVEFLKGCSTGFQKESTWVRIGKVGYRDIKFMNHTMKLWERVV